MDTSTGRPFSLGERGLAQLDKPLTRGGAILAARERDATGGSASAASELLPYHYLARDGSGHNTPQTAVLIEGRATRDWLELDDYDALGNRTGFTTRTSAEPTTMSYGDQMFMLGQVGVGVVKAAPNVPSNFVNGVTGLAKLAVDGNARLLNMAGVLSDARLNSILGAQVPQVPMVLEASKDPRYAAAQRIGMVGGDVVWGAAAPGAIVKTFGYAAETATAVRTMVGTSEALAAQAAERAGLLQGPLGSIAKIAESSPFGPVRVGLTIPQGISGSQFDRISSMVRGAADGMGLGDDVFVMGSRAGGTAKTGSDLDIGIRVSAAQFDELIASSFANAKNARAATMEVAARDGRIQAGEAGLSRLGRQVAQSLNFPNNKVQISVLRAGGVFDNGPQTALAFTF